MLRVPSPLMQTCPLISISIVSHGHGAMVATLLHDIRQLSRSDIEILLTLNVPEADGNKFSEFKECRLIENQTAKGFGENHNAAFALSHGQYFLVLNPDVQLNALNISLLLEVLGDHTVGVVAPAVLSSAGKLEITARRFPTLGSLLKKALLGIRQTDYPLPASPICVDWVAGMFMLFRREAFQSIQGFDERYFLYYEDVDLCRRLQSKGLKAMFHPGATIVHDAQMTSHRKLKYTLWHLQSMMRFLFLPQRAVAKS
jgi:N-acetylglucosaminyl-diphospho-decaprenol L-rhamnosyltransferase